MLMGVTSPPSAFITVGGRGVNRREAGHFYVAKGCTDPS